MDITQDFYNNMASHYDKLFHDWQSTVREQAVILNRIFNDPHIFLTVLAE